MLWELTTFLAHDIPLAWVGRSTVPALAAGIPFEAEFAFCQNHYWALKSPSETMERETDVLLPHRTTFCAESNVHTLPKN